MTHSHVIALIPARGGSKSIPRKNLRSLGGHPLIAYSIAAALESRLVDRVVVSTDDEEIRGIAVRYGAEAPFLRPADLARDDTADLPVFVHAWAWLSAHGDRPDVLVQLRPTSPLRPPGLVDEGLARLFADPGADCVRAVTPPLQNPFKMWRASEEGPYLSPLLSTGISEPYNRPRQELPETYWQTGHLDVIRRETMTIKGSLTGTRVLPLLVEPSYAVDIDTIDQWMYAEWLLRERRLRVVRPSVPRAPSGSPRIGERSA